MFGLTPAAMSAVMQDKKTRPDLQTEAGVTEFGAALPDLAAARLVLELGRQPRDAGALANLRLRNQ